mmetsp:Transcript_7649/g.19660  ORF Transcript_7649/g.19660 Transcript_7649/m.19660 type:complete len:204 (+) Transcript_7649:294-905(+)
MLTASLTQPCAWPSTLASCPRVPTSESMSWTPPAMTIASRMASSLTSSSRWRPWILRPTMRPSMPRLQPCSKRRGSWGSATRRRSRSARSWRRSRLRRRGRRPLTLLTTTTSQRWRRSCGAAQAAACPRLAAAGGPCMEMPPRSSSGPLRLRLPATTRRSVPSARRLLRRSLCRPPRARLPRPMLRRRLPQAVCHPRGPLLLT